MEVGQGVNGFCLAGFCSVASWVLSLLVFVCSARVFGAVFFYSRSKVFIFGAKQHVGFVIGVP